jgi:hypothetical protein
MESMPHNGFANVQTKSQSFCSMLKGEEISVFGRESLLFKNKK